MCVLEHLPFCQFFASPILLALVGVALESAVLIQGPEGSGADPLATTSDRAQNHITETEYPSTGSAVVKMVTKGYGASLRTHASNYLEFGSDHIVNTSDLPADAHAEPCDDCPKGEVQGCRPHDASPSFYFRAS